MILQKDIFTEGNEGNEESKLKPLRKSDFGAPRGFWIACPDQGQQACNAVLPVGGVYGFLLGVGEVLNMKIPFITLLVAWLSCALLW